MSNLGEWNKDLANAKREAHTNNRPLLVFAGSSETCHWCQIADEKVFSQDGWKKYAAAKGIPQYYADESFAATRKIRRAIGSEYKMGLWPTVLIFKIKDTADFTTTDLDTKKNAELIGMFLYRNTATYTLNGKKLKISAPTPENFERIIESFYSSSHPEWTKDLTGNEAQPPSDLVTLDQFRDKFEEWKDLQYANDSNLRKAVAFLGKNPDSISEDAVLLSLIVNGLIKLA